MENSRLYTRRVQTWLSHWIQTAYLRIKNEKNRKQFDYEASDEEADTSEGEKCRIAYIKTVDAIIEHRNWRIEKL